MALVNTKHMFEEAYKNGYAVGAFNVNNMEIIQGIVDACAKHNAPVILQVSNGAKNYARIPYIIKMIEAALIEHPDLEVALHLDHGSSFELCKECIDGGFTSVMIDGSSLPYEENIAVAKKVAEYAHDVAARGRYITVEAELGTLAGVEDEVNVSAEDSSYTRPEQVEDFVKRTGVDSLAIAIGTSHGAFKFKPGTKPELRFDILEEVGKRLPNFPIVLHGASSVNQEYVEIINANGGKLDDAIGVPEELLRKAASMAVCKINIDSDLRLALTAGVRESLNKDQKLFDPRGYLKPGRNYVQELVEHKLTKVLGCGK
ncbi:MAG: class II fructose-1,6-bisphosphate aldolase [Bacilli bacterium]|nr:class II fructose-1,6-bisphosphate aldolase [Bacilli bacterium]